MKNKKTILAAVVASVVASASSYAKLGGAYIGLNGVNVFSDTVVNAGLKGASALGNMSTNKLGFGIEAGYNYGFGNMLIGGGLSYIYAAPNFKHVAEAKKTDVAGMTQDINGHRINLDISAGYVLENKVTLNVGGIVSYNPGKPKYTIPAVTTSSIPAFDKKITSDFGFGFKVGTGIKLTECMSFDISYRMTWFSTTKDYKKYVENNNKGVLNGDDAVKVSKLNRVDKMITAGIRFNF